MKKLLATLLFLMGPAMAAPLDQESIDNMVSQSEAVMFRGLCQVANDKKDYGSAEVIVALPGGLVRRVSKNLYVSMQNLGYSKAPSGLYAMSQWIVDGCSKEALGPECLAARGFWDRFPKFDRPPGNGVVVR